eukprot:3432763-Amphidinium_carterae.1
MLKAPRSRRSGGKTRLSVALPIPAPTFDPAVSILSTWGPVTAAGGWHAGGVGITALFQATEHAARN